MLVHDVTDGGIVGPGLRWVLRTWRTWGQRSCPLLLALFASALLPARLAGSQLSLVLFFLVLVCLAALLGLGGLWQRSCLTFFWQGLRVRWGGRHIGPLKQQVIERGGGQAIPLAHQGSLRAHTSSLDPIQCHQHACRHRRQRLHCCRSCLGFLPLLLRRSCFGSFATCWRCRLAAPSGCAWFAARRWCGSSTTSCNSSRFNGAHPSFSRSRHTTTTSTATAAVTSLSSCCLRRRALQRALGFHLCHKLRPQGAARREGHEVHGAVVAKPLVTQALQDVLIC
mmetsp:Transcript_164/g.369  ORF Transcript_164/g.369 Transcript_164/m.369 type:complete len:282 (-) Transcript_164:2907-3752(-)